MTAITEAMTGMMQKFEGTGNIIGQEPHLRDWSEVLVITAAIYTLSRAILNRKKNVSILNNPNLWVFGALVVAEVRIRQLWMLGTLDNEADRLDAGNQRLRQDITNLTEQNKKLRDENAPLKEAATRFETTEAQLRKEIADLKKAEGKEGILLAKLQAQMKKILGKEVTDIQELLPELEARIKKIEEEKQVVKQSEEDFLKQYQEFLEDKKKLLKDQIALNAGEEQLKKNQEALQTAREALDIREAAVSKREADLLAQ